MWDIVRQATVQFIKCHSKYIKCVLGEYSSAATISQVRQNFAAHLIRLGESDDADGFAKQKTGLAVCVCDNASK